MSRGPRPSPRATRPGTLTSAAPVWPAVLALIWCLCPRAAADRPLLVGGYAHGADNIAALARLGMGNFVWIPAQVYPTLNVPWDDENTLLDDVDACIAHGLHFMYSQRRGLGDVLRPGGYEYGGHADEFRDEATCREVMQRGGGLFVGLHGEELDADFIQNALRPSFRTRSPELYRFSDRAGGRRAYEGELRRLTERYHRWGAPFIANSCVTYQHATFRSGADMVIAELLEHLPTTELQLAYLRGGARQFGGDWGVWVSPWWIGKIPCEDTELWPGAYAEVGGGHSPSAFRRCLYLAFVSGARLLCCQETAPLLARGADGTLSAASWGRELQAFWSYARAHDAPFNPIVPLAVLVDADNGWSPANLWINWTLADSVWGKLQPDRSDAMLAEYLNVLLPGFRRTREAVERREDVYPGYFAATPHGPFDIVASDVDIGALAAYPAVVLLGEVDMTDALRETLRAYVHRGGTLLVNVLQMRSQESFVQDVEFLGAELGAEQWTRIMPGHRVLRTAGVLGVESDEFAEPWFACVEVQPRGAEIVATTENGVPVLLRHRFGAGTVYLSTPEYMQEGWGEQRATLGFFRELVASFASLGDAAVVADGDISWVAARHGADLVFAIANHGSEERRARLSWRGVPLETRVEVGPETGSVAHPETEGIAVPAEDIVVVRATALFGSSNAEERPE